LTFTGMSGILAPIGSKGYPPPAAHSRKRSRGEKTEEAAMRWIAIPTSLPGGGDRRENEKKAGSFASARRVADRSGSEKGRLPSTQTFFGTVVIAIAALLLPALLPQTVSAREDSARLVFQKSAGPRKTRLYVVKKGEFITSIFRNQQGDEPVPFALIRQLNPDIKDLNRIYPGQRIVLPVRETIDLPESSPIDDKASKIPSKQYSIREGDSISLIILTELDVGPERVLSAYRLLRRLNPDIADMNQLPAGQLLNLPQNLVRTERPAAEPVQTAALPPETPSAEPPTKVAPITERQLGIIDPVIRRMKGSLTAAGNYFIPLKDTAQVTIDCSLIPVVELDDGSTTLLDFGNRLSDNLKALISQSWTNYSFLSAEELRDDIASLQGIIRRSRDYTMSRVNTPLALMAKPEILVFPDWIIAAKKAVGGVLYRQGLFLLGDGERPLPAGASAVLEKHGLVVTEISEGATPAISITPTPTPVIQDLRGLKGIALAEGLLKILGEAPLRNAGVVIFEQARDGFNLSVTVDLLLQRGEKRYIIHTRRLPDQFVRVLKDQGAEVIFLRENAPRRSQIEDLLRQLNIPVSFGHFSFRIPEEGRSRLITTFPALRTTDGGEPLYLFDFDVSPDTLSLLRGRLGGRVAMY
jgi:hypothetical protein